MRRICLVGAGHPHIYSEVLGWMPECDLMLLGLHAQEGRLLVVSRPGLMVGPSTLRIMHGGRGFFNAEQGVIGWNRGRSSLRFVLADDTGAAILCAQRAEQAVGRCYNLVVEVWSRACEFLAWLAVAIGCRLHFAKWLLKRADRRRSAPSAQRDLLSRGLQAPFDCSDAKRYLGSAPVADPAADFATGP